MSDAAAPAPSSTPVESSNVAPSAEPKSEPARQLIDLGDEKMDLEALKRERKKWQEADKRFREVAKERESIAQFRKRLADDPESVLAEMPELGSKKYEIAQKWLLEHMDQEAGRPPDPRDDEIRKLKRALQERQEREEQERQTQEQREFQAAVEDRKNVLGATLAKAIELTPFAKVPELQAEAIREMASYMRMLKQAGYEASPEEIADHVKNQRLKAFQLLVSHLDGEGILEVLGQDLAKKVQRAHLAKIRTQRQAPPPKIDESWQPDNSNAAKREFADPFSLRRR
jgi:hypothetical protein